MPDLTGARLLAARPAQEWSCPNCWTTEVSAPLPANAAPMHTCAGLHGLTAPLVRAGTRCKVWAQEREDWQGKEITQDDEDGRPFMAVVTTKESSQDVAVLAPCAQMYG